MPARVATINLLPKSEVDSSFWGKFLKWALTSGRYIIILTEVVVIAAFLSRFKLDSDLADLAERVEGKKKILEALSENERLFRLAQARLGAVAGLTGKQLGSMPILIDLDSSIPDNGGVVIDRVGVSSSEISLGGTSRSEAGLGELLTRLSRNPKWKSVELSDISTDVEKGTFFSINLKQ